MYFEQLSNLYNEIIPVPRLGLTSDSLKGQGIHVFNPNGDPNNPSAMVMGFKIIEHLNGATVDSSPISHEIIDTSSAGTHIQGDSQNYTFWNDGLSLTPEHICSILGNYHNTSTNMGHFSKPGTGNTGLIASTNDLIWAGMGDDAVYAKTGADTVHGGTGNDILDGGTGNDIIYGEEDSDFIFGGAGDDTLDGGSSNDVIEGGAGSDLIVGGDGFDFASYEGASSAVVVKLTDQTSSLGFVGFGELGVAQDDALASIEGIVGSSYDDSIVGNSLDNELWGADGADVINAGAGNDFIYGGDGDNTLLGGLGNDLIYGGEGADTFSGDGGTDVLRGGNGDDAYGFMTGSQVERVIETGTSTGDMAFIVGIANLGIYKNGNDLILTANNYADQMYLADWYVNKGVDLVVFYDTQVAYTTEYVASLALDITPTAAAYSLNANVDPAMTNTLDSTTMASNVELSGIDLNGTFAALSC